MGGGDVEVCAAEHAADLAVGELPHEAYRAAQLRLILPHQRLERAVAGHVQRRAALAEAGVRGRKGLEQPVDRLVEGEAADVDEGDAGRRRRAHRPHRLEPVAPLGRQLAKVARDAA